jgi:hypothetical protein
MLTELQKALVQDQKIQVTVWDPENENVEYSFPSFVMSKVGTLFMIAPPTTQQQKIVPLLQPGITVGGVLETYPNPFIFYPFVHAVPEKDQKGYWLKIPEDAQVEVIQRRKHVRIPMIVPFEIEYTLLGGAPLKVPARTEDVSGGGMRFTSVTLFPVGKEIEIQIQFNPNLPILNLKAKVVMSNQNRLRRQADDLYTTACQFLDMDDAREMIIVRECFRRELGRKE